MGSVCRQRLRDIGKFEWKNFLRKIIGDKLRINPVKQRLLAVIYGIISTMNLLAKLDQLDPHTATQAEMAAVIQSLIAQVQRDAKTIQAKDVKIEALTHELAYIRRIRYGVKSETLSPIQRDVFEETSNTDLAAIEAEVEQLQDDESCDTVTKPKRPRAGRQPLPAHLPRIEHRHEPESCTCGACGKALVKIRDDCRDAGGRATQEQLPETSRSNWMLSPPSFLFIGIYALWVYSPPICVQKLRNHQRCADSASGDRRRHGGCRFVGLGDDQ
jgi:hypothetical protein